MAYLATIHGPSSVRLAVKLRFLNEDVDSLVVAKANRLEIYEKTPDGMVMSYSRAINGKITFLAKVKAPDSKLEHLFLGTDRFVFFSLSWDDHAKQLKTEKTYVDQAEKTGREACCAERCLVDPTQRFMLLELFEGILTVLPLTYKEIRRKGYPETRVLGEPIPVRVEELFIVSSTFLFPENKKAEDGGPKLAIIYKDNKARSWLQIKQLDYTAGKKGETGDADFKKLGSPRRLSPTSTHIIPVPGPNFGMLVLSESTITYYGLSATQKPVHHALSESTIFTAWEQVEDNRWLLGDDYGRLFFLMIVADGQSAFEAKGFQMDCLGSTSRASVILYLGGGYAYIGSHSGNTQLIQIQSSGLEVLQTLPNIAPILDFTIMDMGNRSTEEFANEYSSGQARIVAGSGAFQDGSLRSVRSGVALEDLGSLGDIGHVIRLFPLCVKSKASDVLVASLIDETRAFRFSADGEVEELETLSGFSFVEETLLAVKLLENRILQCTKSAARIIGLENENVEADWTSPPDTTILSASASNDRAVLLISGRELVVLQLNDHLKEAARKVFDEENQISCVDVSQIHPNVCIVGFWHSADITILNLENLETVRSIRISDGGDAVPRSILLTQILPNSPTLFIAMADGHVVTFDVQISNWELTSRKTTILGTQHANLQSIPRGDGLFNVFATCEHPSLIYGSGDRIVYSAITAEKTSCVCPFDSEAYQGAIAIATAGELKVALVDQERTTHVQTLPIDETVRRIAYSPDLKAFGLGTIRRSLVNGKEVVQSHFKLADEVVFKELDTFELKKDEVVESVARAYLESCSPDPVERFIVGTGFIDPLEPDTIRGRILIFEVTGDRMLRLLTNHEFKGACRSIVVMEGKIVAALSKSVVTFAYQSDELRRLALYHASTAPVDIAAVGSDLIAVVDMMKSVALVRYLPGKAGAADRMIEIARHYQIVWGTAIAWIDDDTYLESDAEGNLTVLTRNLSGVTDDDRRRLEVTSEIQLGEVVNRIHRINVRATSDSPVIPRAFMATVEGSVYLFALIRSDKQDFLMRLQENIAECVQSPGGITFAKYRAFRSTVRETDGPYRFVDGDLVERFLDCSPEVQERIVVGLGTSVESTRLIVETLRRLH